MKRRLHFEFTFFAVTETERSLFYTCWAIPKNGTIIRWTEIAGWILSYLWKQTSARKIQRKPSPLWSVYLQSRQCSFPKNTNESVSVRIAAQFHLFFSWYGLVISLSFLRKSFPFWNAVFHCGNKLFEHDIRHMSRVQKTVTVSLGTTRSLGKMWTRSTQS